MIARLGKTLIIMNRVPVCMIEPRDRLFDIADINDPLKLYAALALVLEVGLGAIVVAAPSQTVQIIAVFGMIAVVALMVIVAGRQSVHPMSTGSAVDPKPPWNLNDEPLDSAEITACEGVWRCNWTVRTPSGEFKDYVDDTITIRNVDHSTGNLEGTGTTVYEGSHGYSIRGCLSDTGFAYMYYTGTHLHKEKAGFIILQFYFQQGEAQGWWLGGGRGARHPPVGGYTVWTKDEKVEDEWVDKAY